MDKISTGYEDQGDWSVYKESEEISVHLPNNDNESSGSEILPRKRKCKFPAHFFIIKSYRKGLKGDLKIKIRGLSVRQIYLITKCVKNCL